jgi:RNA polymerase sigma factor for flagellar operon FliA
MKTAQLPGEAELWTQWRVHGDACAREELASRYAGYARVIAATCYARHHRDEIEFADYYQLAWVGMMEALDRFDPQYGVQFKTFASRRMHGAILDGLECMTEKQQQIAARSRMRAQRLEGFAEGAPGPAGRAQERVLGFVADVGLGLALSWMLDGTGMIEVESRAETIPFYRSTELRELRQRLLGLVEALPEQERAVVRGHYLQECAFEEIAVQLQLTRGRISQIHRRAIERLGEALRSERGPDILL